MKKRTYWDILRQDILSNKTLIFLVVFTGILCFGFTITNASIGIDDPARSYYLYSSNQGSMIQQGRLMHVLFNFLTRSVQFLPFFTDFVGAVLYTGSTLLFCALFQYITENRISTSAMAAFSCVYISSSILAEKFIYHLDVIVTMLSYCFMALALLYAYKAVKERSRLSVGKAVPVLMAALASYESFIGLYICCVFAIFILEILIRNEKRTVRTVLLDGVKYAGILLAALLLYYGLVYLVQAATGQLGMFQRFQAVWPEGLNLVEIFFYVTKQLYLTFLQAFSQSYLPILVFSLFSLIGASSFAILALRRKSMCLLLCFLGFWASNFIIHYAAGSFLYRAAQTFCFFCGFTLLILLEVHPQPALRKTLCTAAALLVFVQSADMNRWFYNDYVRYQKESFVIHTLATKLVSDHDLSKPVVFTNAPYAGYLDTALYSGRQVNGNSLVYWAGYAWNDKTQPLVSEVFRMYGYDFVLSPTEEQYDQAHLEAEDMPVWPQEGSVAEFEDFIVVNLG